MSPAFQKQIDDLEESLRKLNYTTAVMHLYLPNNPYRHLVRIMGKLGLISDFFKKL